MKLPNSKSYYLSGIVTFSIAVSVFYISTTDTPVNHAAKDEQSKVASPTQQKPSNVIQQAINVEKFVENWKRDIAESSQTKETKAQNSDQENSGADGEKIQQLQANNEIGRIESGESADNAQHVESTESVGSTESVESAEAEKQEKLLEEMVALASGDNIDFGEPRPNPSSNNINSMPIAEYADQIDQAAINEQAKTQGIALPAVDPNSHPPTSANLSSKPAGEHSEQIDQKAIYAQAKRDGLDLPASGPVSGSPTNDNISLAPTGEYSDQIGGQPLEGNPNPDQN